MYKLRDDSGQATAEYALVMVAAALVATALIAWATSSGMLQSIFQAVADRIKGMI